MIEMGNEEIDCIADYDFVNIPSIYHEKLFKGQSSTLEAFFNSDNKLHDVYGLKAKIGYEPRVRPHGARQLRVPVGGHVLQDVDDVSKDRFPGE